MDTSAEDIVIKAAENLTKNVNSTTGRIPATPEGMAVAYASLIVMAVVPIFFGSYRSVKHHKEQQVRHVYIDTSSHLPTYTHFPKTYVSIFRFFTAISWRLTLLVQ